ncbi:Nucleolar protein 16 [Orbilia brochopaga]|uniref:Nucleolar protein 16 n=1 Tax=Orbilia brochopaga TaxID=3140254 RepID=A0AAV9V7R0_9PEZI
MGRELQKKKNRSSVNKVTRRKQNVRKIPTVTGNKLVASQWDKSQTLAQNYARLGLTHRLRSATGGKEQRPSHSPEDAQPSLGPQEARIKRAADGSILRIEYANDLRHETLGASSDDDERTATSTTKETDLVKALRERTAFAVKTERSQSEREVDWVRRLVEKHGDDYQAMFWDRELNIRQQSVGDIKRRVKKWKESQAKA